MIAWNGKLYDAIARHDVPILFLRRRGNVVGFGYGSFLRLRRGGRRGGLGPHLQISIR